MNFFHSDTKRVDAEVERRLCADEEQCANPSTVIVNFFTTKYGMDKEEIDFLWDIVKVCGLAYSMKNTQLLVHSFVDNNRDDFIVLIASFVQIIYSDGGEDSFIDGNICSENLTEVQRTSLIELFDEKNEITDAIVQTLFNFLCDTSFSEISNDERDMFWTFVSNAFTSKEKVEEFNAVSRMNICN